jgi:hypothetical protein
VGDGTDDDMLGGRRWRTLMVVVVVAILGLHRLRVVVVMMVVVVVVVMIFLRTITLFRQLHFQLKILQLILIFTSGITTALFKGCWLLFFVCILLST